MLFGRPEVAVGGEEEALALLSLEEERLGPQFAEARGRHEDPKLVIERPQPGVEQPVGVLGEGHAVPRIVVPTGAEGVDVRRIHDAPTAQ